MPFCSRCGKELPSDAKFCLECGASVAAPIPTAPAITAKPESKTGRNIVIAIALILVLLVIGALGYGVYEASKPPPATPSPTPAWTPEPTKPLGTLVDESPFINYGSYWHVSTVFQQGMSIYVSIRVEEGGPIDVLLMDSGQFLEFQRFMEGRAGSFYHFRKGSALNVKSISFTFTFPSNDRYFIVLNNAGHIEGGADPVGDVTVYIKVTVSP